MSEEGEVIEGEGEVTLTSAADEAVQRRAEGMGWIPPERYKGDPERFIDADEFVRRGEEILPIVKQQKAKLEGEVTQLRGKVSHLEGLIVKNQETMEALEKFHTEETKRKVAEVRKGLRAEIARASSEGDHEALAEATDQLAQLNVAEKEAADERPVPKAPPPAQPDPVFEEWRGENDWFGTDRRRTGLAMAIAQEMREGGDARTGREFLDAVAEEVQRSLAPARRASPNKVGGGARPSGVRPAGGKSYADLPSEAKEACASYAKQLVGEGRRYKDLASWQAAYAKTYFEEA